MTTYESKETIRLEFDSRSYNERFARVAIGAIAARLDPTLEEIEDLKTAVSEAVTNCIIHGYPKGIGRILMEVEVQGRSITVRITDQGVGIWNIQKAREPFYTTAGADRSGMGFCFMESFMDELEVKSAPGQGTTVIMKKNIGAGAKNYG